MKDTDKVELTVGNIKAAGKCGTAKEVLKELFPEVFRESEWEDVTNKFSAHHTTMPEYRKGLYLKDIEGNCPFFVSHVQSCLTSMAFIHSSLKFSEGRIWRRKSE